MTAGRPCCDSPVKGAARQRCRTCHRRGLQTRAVCTAGFGQGARSWWPGVSAALRWSGRSVRPSSGCVLDRNLEAHQVGGATTGSPRAWNPSLIPSAVSTLYRQCLAHRDGQRAGGAIVLPEPRTPGSLAAYGGPLPARGRDRDSGQTEGFGRATRRCRRGPTLGAWEASRGIWGPWTRAGRGAG